MNIAINTGSLAADTAAALETAARLGFTAVEVNLQPAEFGYGFARKVDFGFYQRLGETLKARGLAVTSVHCPGLNGPQAFSSRVRGEMLKAAARIVAQLGAPVLVAHPTHVFTTHEALEQYFAGVPSASPPVVEGYDEAWAQLANQRIALGLENISYWSGAAGTNRPDRLGRLVEDLAVHAVLDVRRSLPAGPGAELALRRWIDALGTRIVLVHVHDASAAGEHEPPLAADWPALAALLRETRARAAVLEVDLKHGEERLVASRDYIGGLLAARE